MAPDQVSTYEERQEWRKEYLLANDLLVINMPKIELHVHIEGTMSPDMRWELAQRNNIRLTAGSDERPLTTLAEVRDAYTKIRGRISKASADASTFFTFFQIYFGGFAMLKTEQDFYDLAMDYLKRVASTNVRYCEPFFDPQGHTCRGISMEVIMTAFKRAKRDAERDFDIKSQWIMCILRDYSPESAIAHYDTALAYRDMIIGIGLDSDEYNRPPSLFQEVFRRAREDGFKITNHCDFNQKDTHEHIRQVCEIIGADRIDHGINAADRDDLLALVKTKQMGLTLCPCAYIRHAPELEVFPRIRKLFDAGLLVTIASDDPAYMEDNYLVDNLLMVRNKCKFTDVEMIQLQRNAITICWAPESLKRSLLADLENFANALL